MPLHAVILPKDEVASDNVEGDHQTAEDVEIDHTREGLRRSLPTGAKPRLNWPKNTTPTISSVGRLRINALDPASKPLSPAAATRTVASKAPKLITKVAPRKHWSVKESRHFRSSMKNTRETMRNAIV